jgi:AcrR family transcriptional regulator
VTGFQRARSEEQRAARRRAVLDAAAAMLAEMPVARISLNELSRRAGLAKSNVLRYFDSREAVLLELLDVAWRGWLEQLAGELADGVPAAAPLAERVERVAAVLAGSLGRQPVLCDLLGAQAAVLERNVSPRVAADFKRAALGNTQRLAELVRARVAELGEPGAFQFVGAAGLVAGAVWVHTHPSAAMLAAYESDPELAAMRLEFATVLRELLAVLLAGVLARPMAPIVGIPPAGPQGAGRLTGTGPASPP